MEIIRSEQDFYTSVLRAFDEIDPNYRDYPGLVIVGSHAPFDVEAKIQRIREAREGGYPFLGICMGFQLMLIEWVRHCGYGDATSQEIEPSSPRKVIKRLPALRVGTRKVKWHGKTRLESHWHHYGFAREYASSFPSEQWELSYTDGVLEIAQLKGHPFFLGTQYHPEYQSIKGSPHPILKDFLEHAKRIA